VHHAGVVLAGENVPRSTHIGGKLIHFVDPVNRLFHDIRIPKVGLNELISRRRAKLMTLDVDRPDPIAFGFQPSYQMTADESTSAVYQNAFHACSGEMVFAAGEKSQKHLATNEHE
jgi:hypothetical protein